MAGTTVTTLAKKKMVKARAGISSLPKIVQCHGTQVHAIMSLVLAVLRTVIHLEKTHTFCSV